MDASIYGTSLRVAVIKRPHFLSLLRGHHARSSFLLHFPSPSVQSIANLSFPLSLSLYALERSSYASLSLSLSFTVSLSLFVIPPRAVFLEVYPLFR